MLEVVKFINSRFTSNTYIIAHPEYDNIWVVDPGDTDNVFEWMKVHSKTYITGILLTHAHFDYIYGMNEIFFRFPDCTIYVANNYGKESLKDPKKNGSKYIEEGPIELKEGVSLDEYEDDMFLWCDFPLRVLYTPGHSDDSVSLIIDGMLFTGDTLIKDVRTVTKLKGGSIEKLNHRVKLLSELKGLGLMVMPGHGDAFELDKYDLAKVDNNPVRKSNYVSKNET